MLYDLLKLTHVLSILVWLGGMVFAHFFLRPAVSGLQPPDRLRLMHDVLGRFFQAVLVLSSVAVVSGIWMIGRVAKQTVQSGLDFNMPLSWTIMATLGIVMMAIFGHIRFALFKRLSQAVSSQDWTAGSAALANIRTWVGINLGLGIAIIAVTALLA